MEFRTKRGRARVGVRAAILLGAEGAALAFRVACLLLGERLPRMLAIAEIRRR